MEWIKLDDESEPKKADANARRLVQQDKVDVIVGTVHSGVQMAIQKVVAESGTLSIIPNAGVHAVTRNACLPNVFRTSFTMGQPTVALGQAMIERKARRAVWVTWDYPAGADSLEGFREGYVKAGGSIVKELKVPFPSTDFSAVLAEIAQLKPDAVACFFAGGGAVKFMQDYEKAGLRQGLEAVQGDTGKRDQFYGAMEAAVIDSPRGQWRMGKAHNPVQDIYLRTVANGENRIIGVAAKALEDSGAGCKLA